VRKGWRRYTVRVPGDTAALIEQLAEAYAVTRSTAAGRLLCEAARLDAEHQHASLIEAAVGRAIARQLDRLSKLAIHAALDSGEARRLLVYLLARQIGTDSARALRREVHGAAWQQLREPIGPPAEGRGAWTDAPRAS
jgi:hypothetical protein